MKNKISKILYKGSALLITLVMLFGVFGVVSNAQMIDAELNGLVLHADNFVSKLSNTDLNFDLESAEGVFNEENSVGAIINDCTDDEGVKYSAVHIGNREDIAVYNFAVKQDGWYSLEISYILDAKQSNDLTFAICVNDNDIVEENENIVLPRYWINDGEKRTDIKGNEIAPKQKTIEKLLVKTLKSENNTAEEPVYVYLSAGDNKIAILNATQNVNIVKLSVVAPEKVLTYEEVKKIYAQNNYVNYSGKPLCIQGEDAFYKTARSLIAKCDRSSAKLTPSSAVKDLLNYIGGTSWQENGDEIIWKVDVPASGLYKLGFSYLQNTVINGTSYRNLKINGKTPFEEAKYVEFSYETSWNDIGFCDKNGEPYLIYLEKGTQEISLSVTLGKAIDSYNMLNKIVSDLGDLYIDITIITGESPDVNRDYELFKKIPDWDKRLNDNIDALNKLSEYLKNLSNENGSTIVAAVENSVRVIKNMKDNRYTAQIYLSDYYTTYTTLSSWLFEMKRMPLSIDVIELSSPATDYSPKEVSFFQNLAFGFKRFLASFLDDYNSISADNANGKQLKIWVNWGRDQAMVLNNLIQESFSEYAKNELGYNVSVKVELVNATLVKGILSGNAPDLALHLSRTEPVNLAMRGALVDLSSFDDFESVLDRFGSTATLPYTYNGKTYALPDQQTFYLMFYRKDILEELGITEIPKTWDEFLATTAVLQRNNMNSYIPYTQIASESTVNAGIGNLNLYPTILQQRGGNFYNDELNRTTLDSSLSVASFKYWVDMYTLYKIPTDADFYNRFRLGTMPLGISSYTLYNTLAQAAPEIKGRWGIALVPGTLNEKTGEINKAVSGGGTGCSILKTSENQKEAWVFLKWWTEAQTQLDYNNNIESIIGATARVPLATKAAFEQLAWDPADLPILMEQFSMIKEIPEVPGSYYVSRAVDQAFWNVVSNGINHKDVLINWSKIANEEIARKIKEYN